MTIWPHWSHQDRSSCSASWGSGAVSGGRSACSCGGGGGWSTCGLGVDLGSCCGGVGTLSLSGVGSRAIQPTFAKLTSTQAWTSLPLIWIGPPSAG
ncbi:hypothetical protein ACFFX0_27460 [Citricoccus parietis]|uniref:Uncharacterized protein n=1 Tax=Citricoccus parietis TaxID=592307 RepID=A0ABV5G752_9MICC